MPSAAAASRERGASLVGHARVPSLQLERAEVAQRRGGDLGAQLEAARDVATVRVFAHEAGRECIAGARGVRRRATPAGRRRRCAARGSARRRRPAPSVTTNRRWLSVRRRSSASISAPSLRLQAEQPDVELGSPARGERDGIADVVGVREVDRAQPWRPHAMTDSKNVRPCAERGRREHVAGARSPRAGARSRGSRPERPRRSDRTTRSPSGAWRMCCTGVAPGTTSRQGSTPVRAWPRRARDRAPASSPIGATTVTVALGRAAPARVDRDVQADAACAVDAAAVVAVDPAVGGADDLHARAAASAATCSRRRAPVLHQARADDRAVGDGQQRAALAGSSPLPISTGQLAGARRAPPAPRPARAARPCACP